MSFYAIIESILEKKTALLLMSLLLCFGCLGAHDLWTQEQRWADIVSMMFLRQDFLHPYLRSVPYYDKPLLSYWLIAAVVGLTNDLSNLTLRIPSAICGLLGLFGAYTIAKNCFDKKAAMLFVWMFLSLFFYIFWARTASADIFNVAGILLAIAIYLTYRNRPSFISFLCFFTVVFVTSLCKGIVAAALIAIIVGIDVLLRRNLKQYMTISFWTALLFGVTLFCIPFVLSQYYPDANFISNKNSGLYLVYKENVVRFFQPFDHQEPFYVYLIYLPLYLFPWIILFIPAFYNRMRNWSQLNVTSRWIVLSFCAIFLFFTISGSRRSYYVLPVLPFALLLILDWLEDNKRFIKYAKIMSCISVAICAVFFIFVQPLFYSQYGVATFLKKITTNITSQPLTVNNVAMLDVPSKFAFYLNIPSTAIVNSRESIIKTIKSYELIPNSQLPMVILTRKEYALKVDALLPGIYNEERLPNVLTNITGKTRDDSNEMVALIKRV